MLHPNVNLVSDPNAADIIVYLPTSGPFLSQC